MGSHARLAAEIPDIFLPLARNENSGMTVGGVVAVWTERICRREGLTTGVVRHACRHRVTARGFFGLGDCFTRSGEDGTRGLVFRAKPRLLSPCKRLFSPVPCRGHSGNSRLAPTSDSAARARRTRTAANPNRRKVRKTPLYGLGNVRRGIPALFPCAPPTPQNPPIPAGLADAPRPGHSPRRWTPPNVL